MKRFYSHFTFIYPDIYLKHSIIEIDSLHRIVNIFPFEKEIERTEFYSGWLLFIPQNIELDVAILQNLKQEHTLNNCIKLENINIRYNIYSEDGLIISKAL